MRETDELRLAMIVLSAIHAEYGLTVSLRRDVAIRGDPASGPAVPGARPQAACGPRGWRARVVDARTRPSADVWAARPYEAAARLAERLDRASEAVA